MVPTPLPPPSPCVPAYDYAPDDVRLAEMENLRLATFGLSQSSGLHNYCIAPPPPPLCLDPSRLDHTCLDLSLLDFTCLS
jgi:hypothetical protein